MEGRKTQGGRSVETADESATGSVFLSFGVEDAGARRGSAYWAGVAGANLAERASCGRLPSSIDRGHDPGVAQLAERRTVHPTDAGSNPASGVQDMQRPAKRRAFV